MSNTSNQVILSDVIEYQDELFEIRHDFHQHPERGFETQRTVEKICAKLKEWSVQAIDTELVKGAVVAVIEGCRAGRTIGVRADMDCLSMNDQCGKPWQSQYPGLAHACGHDGHTTWLLGVARYLAEHRDFPGKVVLIFQPAEEIAAGASALIKAGLIEKYGIEEIYGAHCEQLLPLGTIGYKPGALQAACDSFYIDLKGRGTHGARPHLGIDPVPVAAQIVLALQTIVSRRLDPIDPAVVSVCSINSGRYETMNVIAEKCTMSGTVRTFSHETRHYIAETIQKMVPVIAQANDCTAEVRYVFQCAPLINTPEQTHFAIEATEKLIGKDKVAILDPVMSSEDFSAYLEKVPGCIIRVGIADSDHTAALHSGGFDFNDKVLPLAVSVITNVVLERLKALTKNESKR